MRAITPRELEALGHLAKGKTNREIGESMYVSEGTVKSYIGQACWKLEARNRVHLLVRAVQEGVVQL